MEKPKKQNYGWHDKSGFDDEDSGWIIEGGEEAFYKALKKYNDFLNLPKEMDVNKEIETLKEFFESRKRVLKLKNFAYEAGVGESTLHKVLDGEYIPSVDLINKLKRTACKYGYREPIEI